MFRKSVAYGRSLCWIPIMLPQIYFGGQVNNAPVNRRRRDATACGQTSHTCRGFECSSREGRIEIVFRRDEGCGHRLLLPRHGLACCCTENKLQSFKLNDKCSPREARGTSTTELVMFDVAMECHGNRFRTSDHAMVSLAPLKETWSDQHRCSCQTVRR